MAEAALKKEESMPKAKYSEVLAESVRVVIKVPKVNQYGNFVIGHNYRNGRGELISVEPHYEARTVINGEKFQRNIYNWKRSLAGRRVVADVEIRRKVTSKSREVIGLIDINIRPELSLREAVFQLRFGKDSGVEIKGLRTRVDFQFLAR
jgi:hypothetical protein